MACPMPLFAQNVRARQPTPPKQPLRLRRPEAVPLRSISKLRIADVRLALQTGAGLAGRRGLTGASAGGTLQVR